MSEQKKFKVGDKVHVIGHPNIEGRGQVLGVEGDWYVIGSSLIPMERVHLRNLDPVLEDERRGAPRPPIQEGELVDVTFRGQCYLAGCGLMILNPEEAQAPRGWINLVMASDPRVRQIERRNPGCKACMDRGCNEPGCTARGREARKS